MLFKPLRFLSRPNYLKQENLNEYIVAKFMTSPIDIYTSANELIKKHREDAPIHAAMRHDELLEAGDIEGASTWKRIIRAIDELLSEEVPVGTSLN
jgi:hypothetical protein